MTNIDKAKTIIRIIKQNWLSADQAVMSTTADLAAERVRGQWATKDWEDDCGGIGSNPRDRSGSIKHFEQRLRENKAERDAWQEVYDYAVEKFLEKGV